MSKTTRTGLALLTLLVIVDLLLIGLHVVHAHTPFLEQRIFAIDRDAGVGEHFQYLKAMWIALAFLVVAVARSERAFALWAGFFTYLMLDDAGEIHERIGLLFAEMFNYPGLFGLRPQDVGELTVALLLGTSLVTLVGIGYVRGSDAFRKVTRTTILLLGALAFFGVVVDALHILWSPRGFDPLLLVEDGGEMLVMSGLAVYAWLLVARNVRLDRLEEVEPSPPPRALRGADAMGTMAEAKLPRSSGGKGA